MTEIKKIAIITTGRQDWGILRSTVKKLNQSDDFEVALIAGGMACDDKFGNIAERIESEGIPIYAKLNWRVDIEGEISACQEISEAVIMAEKCFNKLKPDAVMLLGDRFETLGIAQVATLLKIPIIHLHGGEETQGAMDNQIRHAISKLSHLHFVSHCDHAARLIRMGENPKNVHVVGAPGIDNLNSDDLPDLKNILEELKLQKEDDELIFVITYHPPTLSGKAHEEITNLLDALSEFKGVFIFTLPNNDEGNKYIRDAIEDFQLQFPDKRASVSALGEKRYWSVLKNCDVVIGNSSSGIIEAPAVPVPVVNIGLRQAGRGFSPCVIDVPLATQQLITEALSKAISSEFIETLDVGDSRYGAGNSAEKIYNILKFVEFASLKIKSFYDGENNHG